MSQEVNYKKPLKSRHEGIDLKYTSVGRGGGPPPRSYSGAPPAPPPHSGTARGVVSKGWSATNFFTRNFFPPWGGVEDADP